MADSQTFETCGEHKLSSVDKKGEMLERLQRAQWLRAAVLGANDGLLSTASLMLGVGSAKEDQWSMVLSGIAGAIAGACSMAVGEFVSVSTQRDIETSVIEQCKSEDKLNHENDVGNVKIQIINETKANVVVSPAKLNLSPFRSPARSPMMKVVVDNGRTKGVQVEEKEVGDNGEDADGALPNPYKAAAASAVSFLCGSFVPLLAAMLVSDNITRIVSVVVVASVALALFGAVGAFLGGSSLRVSAARVLLGGWISMAVTYGLLKPLDKDDRGGKDKNRHNG